MKLEEGRIEKADPLLQDALKQAEENVILRTVMLLSPANEIEEKSSDPVPDPSQFSSRMDYRQALIEQRQAQLAGDIGPTLQALRDMALTPRGGAIGRSVVVEGTARQILASLDLPGVEHVSLDRPIELAESRAEEAKDQGDIAARGEGQDA